MVVAGAPFPVLVLYHLGPGRFRPREPSREREVNLVLARAEQKGTGTTLLSG